MTHKTYTYYRKGALSDTFINSAIRTKELNDISSIKLIYSNSGSGSSIEITHNKIEIKGFLEVDINNILK